MRRAQGDARHDRASVAFMTACVSRRSPLVIRFDDVECAGRGRKRDPVRPAGLLIHDVS